MQFVGLNFDVDSEGRASNIYLSSFNDMAFPLMSIGILVFVLLIVTLSNFPFCPPDIDLLNF